MEPLNTVVESRKLPFEVQSNDCTTRQPPVSLSLFLSPALFLTLVSPWRNYEYHAFRDFYSNAIRFRSKRVNHFSMMAKVKFYESLITIISINFNSFFPSFFFSEQEKCLIKSRLVFLIFRRRQKVRALNMKPVIRPGDYSVGTVLLKFVQKL